VKSGAKPDWVIEVLTVFVREVAPGEVGWVKEYTAQIPTIMMIGIAMISHLLNPRLLFAPDCFPESFVLLFFVVIWAPPVVYEERNLTLKLSFGLRTRLHD
jgi:hypothetical protein